MLEKILDKIADMTLLEALAIIRTVLPDNNDFRMLTIQANTLEYDYYSGSITEEVYKVGNVKKRKALDFFLKRMNEGNLAKIGNLLFTVPPEDGLTTEI
jgi:hypothetical protein